MLLLRNSATKCSLLSGAMRNFGAKQDRMITADGQEFYPGHMRRLLNFNDDSFLNRIESFVINKLIELNVTIEEYVLVTVITFCNPGKCSPEFHQ
uniref:NR LBD domain-containing protein n=1 Tax=Caenorhabditis tropicalis TaxID=1561998 RepID=A0A1I7UBH1_9PELO